MNQSTSSSSLSSSWMMEDKNNNDNNRFAHKESESGCDDERVSLCSPAPTAVSLSIFPSSSPSSIMASPSPSHSMVLERKDTPDELQDMMISSSSISSLLISWQATRSDLSDNEEEGKDIESLMSSSSGSSVVVVVGGSHVNDYSSSSFEKMTEGTTTTSVTREASHEKDEDVGNLPRRRHCGSKRFPKLPPIKKPVIKDVDVESYMKSREMTPFQERMNAITMLPIVVYIAWFLMSGYWILGQQQILEEARAVVVSDQWKHEFASGGGFPLLDTTSGGDACFDWSSNSSWWPVLVDWLSTWLPSMPPIPVLAVCAGWLLHTPWSVLYHWRYAHSLPPGTARTNHWSRRMDQSMQHVACAFCCLGTSGHWDFFLVNAAYTIDCFHRQFKQRVRPRRNKIRLLVSCLTWMIPILRRGDWKHFIPLVMLVVVGGWLFTTYPVGRWSHSAFHLIVCLALPLIISVSISLPSVQDSLRVAAQCVALTEQQQQQHQLVSSSS